jgi:tellurite resistance protein TehA-like permease
VTIGLSLALMIITIYLLRLVVHGPPDVSLILSAFIVLGPLGQGGYSLLVNGEVLAHIILPAPGETSALVRPSGQVLFSVCFAGAFVLWSMGVCWIIVAGFSIGNQLRKGPVPFSVAYWWVWLES